MFGASLPAKRVRRAVFCLGALCLSFSAPVGADTPSVNRAADSGLKILAGAGALPIAGQDADNDGVPNAIDVCHNTPSGVPVDEVGRPLGDLDRDCDVDIVDLAIFQVSMTGPLPDPGSPYGACNPLTNPTGCGEQDSCFVTFSTVNTTICTRSFIAAGQEEICQFSNACADGYSCVMTDSPVNPLGQACAFICDASGSGGPNCADGPGAPYQCAPINGFYPNLPDFPQEIGMCIDPNEWSVFDADGDGILNFSDLCPNTPANTRVDAGGCAVPTGACCMQPQVCCLDTTESICNEIEGMFQGVASTCAMQCP